MDWTQNAKALLAEQTATTATCPGESNCLCAKENTDATIIASSMTNAAANSSCSTLLI